MIFVEESAGAEIDGFAGDRHIVGIHHAMDETHHHPSGDEFALPPGDAAQQGEVRIVCLFRLGIMTVDHVVREVFDRLVILARGEELERADTDMACRNAGEDAARQADFALHPFAGEDGRQRPRGGNAKRKHRFRHDIFAQHRAKGRTAVSPA
ncbi:hypothetical protein D3C72_673520 [compost metagenome]